MVISIIAVLVGILLPALGQARAASRDVGCLSNLRTLQTIWANYMVGRDPVIPRTRNPAAGFNWGHALTQVYDSAPTLYGSQSTSFNSCPQVHLRFGAVDYGATSPWGYGVNVWWSDAGTNDAERLNEGKSWDAVKNPSRYPWFGDTHIYQNGVGGNWTSARFAPRTAAVAGPNKGVGVHHSGESSANFSFADGSARGVKPVEFLAGMGTNLFPWFANW